MFVALPVFINVSSAEVRVVTNAEPQSVFCGENRNIAVQFRNLSNTLAEVNLHTRVYQASSASAAVVSEAPWKKLQILPGQTVFDSARVSFPSVRGETLFLVQWLDGTNLIIGTTPVWVYPPEILKELKTLANERTIGLLDPSGQLKSVFTKAQIEFTDLEDSGFEHFDGALAIVSSLRAKDELLHNLASQVALAARKGTAVIWITPVRRASRKLTPSFYTVPEGKGGVVVVKPELVVDLQGNPRSQMNLIELARLALHPEPAKLPGLENDD